MPVLKFHVGVCRQRYIVVRVVGTAISLCHYVANMILALVLLFPGFNVITVLSPIGFSTRLLNLNWSAFKLVLDTIIDVLWNSSFLSSSLLTKTAFSSRKASILDALFSPMPGIPFNWVSVAVFMSVMMDKLHKLLPEITDHVFMSA